MTFKYKVLYTQDGKTVFVTNPQGMTLMMMTPEDALTLSFKLKTASIDAKGAIDEN